MSDRALERLRDPADAALDELVGLAFDALVDRPLTTWMDLAGALDALRASRASLAADAGRRADVLARVQAVRDRLRQERRPLSSMLPSDVHGAADRLATLPVAPSPALVLDVIRHDAVRGLVREVLTGAVTRFVQKVRTEGGGMLGAVGGAAKAGRGLFGGVAASLGAAAEGLAGGLQREVEGLLQGRVEGFVEGAVEETLRTIAAWVADPGHAAAGAALRGSVLRVVLDRPVGDLLAEIDEIPTEHLVAAVLDGGGDDPLPDALLELAADEALGPWLDASGQRDAVRAHLVTALRPAARAVVAEEGFASWWSRLHS